MTTIEILTKARTFIEKGWIQHSFAKDEFGRPVPVNSNLAVGWCAVGACHAAKGISEHEESALENSGYLKLRDSLGLQRGESISHWNDGAERTQAVVLAAFDKAIASCPSS